jgi:hypothetical protein
MGPVDVPANAAGWDGNHVMPQMTGLQLGEAIKPDSAPDQVGDRLFP